MDNSKKITSNGTYHLSNKHHMTIQWGKIIGGEDVPSTKASVKDKSSIVGRVGIQMLSCGTGAWRVRDGMNKIARALGITCSADIGLTSIEYTCFDQEHSYSQTLALPSTGVNTDKLNTMEHFVNDFESKFSQLSIQEIHRFLDKIQKKPGNYSALVAGGAAAMACAAFIFLLGGGPIEMLCCFFGAGIGNYVRRKMIDHHLTTVADTAIGVAVACLAYFIIFKGLEYGLHIGGHHEAGYIGSMLFVIPGFPFITSILDITKLDMRSGLERLAYATMITVIASLVGWLVAMMVDFQPENFAPLGLGVLPLMLLRIPASFCGVYGFSMMFNSSQRMAITAGLIGAVANTLRLELVDLTNIPASAAAFIGALLAGLLASFINKYNGYPRISLTVPSIVIMVPGLYIYRGIYYIGLNTIGLGALWLTKAILIIMFLPLGLFVARFLLDRDWRHFD
ncbi:threonine/serine ThrE exporter family protein [Lentilactobacillus sp. SPB1-3]|uniref:Threonine/serine exporter ThrE family protein n=1 Tax=Lentilactobacillus terminaliae TaxID=3003483 RepID=A0ACD5DGR9_9LACO|nr:threonine/serine exporter family protein [Lentilactobacillus sp. SPB1-3]MCZ0977059.1 threonine/serine exporter family protein [Lentilactobacillus sp. SPB1-3]